MRAFTKKRSAIGIAVVSSIVMAVAAYAYFTTSGTGTGTATTSNGTTVNVAQTTTLSALAPSKPAQNVNFTIANPSTDESGYVATVKVGLTVTPASGAVGSCDASDYVLTGVNDTVVGTDGVATVTIDQDIAAGATVAYDDKFAIAFNNKATNQDGCKGASVALNYVAA